VRRRFAWSVDVSDDGRPVQGRDRGASRGYRLAAGFPNFVADRRNYPVATVYVEIGSSQKGSSDWPAVEVSALKPTALPGPRAPAPLLRLQSDERLIALTRRGQQAAFEALFSRYHSRLLAFCRHMLNSKEDAEDVLQEVFVAAFNAILADERAINVRPWLYRIARNRSLNHLRRASAIGVDDMDVHYANHGMSTGDQVLHRESFRQLIGDVQQLPETQRTALLLREIDALSYEQIAQAMETTVPSVKSLLVRARISLAEASEARQLSCADVREQLGEAAEGLLKIEAPARRHLRDCERCRAFRKHLKDNNHALAAIFPVGPLLLLKKLVLTKFGSTASAGGAHAVGAGGATAGASAAVGAGAGTAGGMSVGGLATAGAGALATKAAATLAAAALVTAGAVAVGGHSSGRSHHHHTSAAASTYAAATVVHHIYAVPAVAQSTAQPTSTLASAGVAAAAAHRRHRRGLHVTATTAPVPPSTATAETPVPTPATVAVPAKPDTDAKPPVTQVTTESTPLPSGATSTSTSTATSTTPAPAEAAPPTPPSAPTNTGTSAETPPPPPTTTTPEATSTAPAASASTPPPATTPAGGEPETAAAASIAAGTGGTAAGATP
jgi:RNA polymerase sigma factor (sigma-70 family)